MEEGPKGRKYTGSEIYDIMARHLIPAESLAKYNFPLLDPAAGPGRVKPTRETFGKQLQATFAPSYQCKRCSRSYPVGGDGIQLSGDQCVYHDVFWQDIYSCCKRGLGSTGCQSNRYHVHRGELLLANLRGFRETSSSPHEPSKRAVFALDTEMAYTPYGLELTRVTLVNYKLEVVYDELVKPESPVLDYNTPSSGIAPGDLDNVHKRLADVQCDLLELLSSESILVGHSLEADLRALKLVHLRIVDTSVLYPHRRGLPYKKRLKTLAQENLGLTIQSGHGHSSAEDARAALRVAYHKAGVRVL